MSAPGPKSNPVVIFRNPNLHHFCGGHNVARHQVAAYFIVEFNGTLDVDVFAQAALPDWSRAASCIKSKLTLAPSILATVRQQPLCATDPPVSSPGSSCAGNFTT
jgi:hypothetical protein